MLNELMKSKKLSIYRVAKESGVPYATLNDMVNGKTQIEKCTAETVYRIARVLNVSVEDLIRDRVDDRAPFDLFRSNVCHRVKLKGDLDFLIETLSGDDIERYYDRGWYPEALYLLAMVDYLSKENNVPVCEKYETLRHSKLKKPIYPSGIRIAAKVMSDEALFRKADAEAIPEFARFNIMESGVRDVC